MHGLRMIACVDKLWGIGKNNKLLFHIPEDMRRFQELTMQCPVIMGRRTWESLPDRPLKGRTNIVVSGHALDTDDFRGAILMPDAVSALHTAERMISHDDSGTANAWVIGGGLIYTELMGYCEEAQITYVDAHREHDTRLFSLDEAEDWELISESEPHTYDGLTYTFRKYRNLAPCRQDAKRVEGE